MTDAYAIFFEPLGHRVLVLGGIRTHKILIFRQTPMPSGLGGDLGPVRCVCLKFMAGDITLWGGHNGPCMRPLVSTCWGKLLIMKTTLWPQMETFCPIILL